MMQSGLTHRARGLEAGYPAEWATGPRHFGQRSGITRVTDPNVIRSSIALSTMGAITPSTFLSHSWTAGSSSRPGIERRQSLAMVYLISVSRYEGRVILGDEVKQFLRDLVMIHPGRQPYPTIRVPDSYDTERIREVVDEVYGHPL